MIFFENNNVILKDIPFFGLADTLDCGQAFRFSNDNCGYTGVVNGRILRICEIDEEIIIHNMKEDEFYDYYYNYFTLDIDYKELEKLFCTDPVMKKAMAFAKGTRLLRQDVFEVLISFIISQNNNIKRIKGIIRRLCEEFGEKIHDDFYAFPTAETLAGLSENDLSPLKAGFRNKYIIDAAKKVYSGEVDLEALKTLPIEDAREQLMKIKGVGPKVAECVLLFGCWRFEAFPLDVWMKRVMEFYYPNGFPAKFYKYGGIAQQYLFHYARTVNPMLNPM